MKKLSSNSMVPATPKGGKAPSVTNTPQQKVGAPVVKEHDGKARPAPKPTKTAKPSN